MPHELESYDLVVIIIKMSSILSHHLLGDLHRVLTMRLRHFFFVYLQVLLLLGLLTGEKIVNFAVSCRSLIDSGSGSELSVCPKLYLVEQVYSKILAVVADQMVRWCRCTHRVDSHLA